MSSSYFFLLSIFFCLGLSATEYVYPVGEKSPIIYYIHQKDPLHLELYALDEATQEHSKLLPNCFNPAGFRLLPNQNGFSFIHNDTVYIKRFSKRSPKRIEFFEPIYGINNIEWIDETTFYFAARYRKHYRIYEGTTDGDLEIIISDDTSDALYPQKINNLLFYIERDAQNKYRILQTIYKSHESKKVITVGKTAIACLAMISETRGFFLSYPSQMKSEDTIITFSYYQIINNKQWDVEFLFDFSIPREFLVDTSQSRLYESIMPLLPKYKNEQLYFMSAQKNSTEMAFFYYDFIQKKIFSLNTDSCFLIKSD